MPGELNPGCPVHKRGLLFWLPFTLTALLMLAALIAVNVGARTAASVLLTLAVLGLLVSLYHPFCRFANRKFGYGHKETK